MKGKIIVFALVLTVISMANVMQAQENWPHWRGPHHNGISDAKNLPMTWSQTENIVWKTGIAFLECRNPYYLGRPDFHHFSFQSRIQTRTGEKTAT